MLHMTGNLYRDANVLDQTVRDVSILHLLGVQLILVAGVNELLDDRIKNSPGRTLRYHNGVRITDEQTLKDIKELSGFARFETGILFPSRAPPH